MTQEARVGPRFTPNVIDLVSQIIGYHGEDDGEAMSDALSAWCLTAAMYGLSDHDIAELVKTTMPLARIVATKLDDYAAAELQNRSVN